MKGLIERVADGHYRSTCEDCGTTLEHRVDLREVVVLRLCRQGWRVRHGIDTWCPACAAEFSAEEAPTSPMRQRL